MVIGIDMDDTICSTNELIIVEADKYDKEVLGGTGVKDVKAYEFNDMLGWAPEMQDICTIFISYRSLWR